MRAEDVGGYAFPWCGDLNETPFIDLGMTLLDYFIAHAPVEPQSWFRPVMEPEPERIDFPTEMTAEESNEYYGWGEYFGTSDLKCPRVRAYAEAVDARTNLMREWNAEYEKQRYVQWPAAWAREMLRARGKT